LIISKGGQVASQATVSLDLGGWLQAENSIAINTKAVIEYSQILFIVTLPSRNTGRPNYNKDTGAYLKL
jgi:hypothetical protein